MKHTAKNCCMQLPTVIKILSSIWKDNFMFEAPRLWLEIKLLSCIRYQLYRLRGFYTLVTRATYDLGDKRPIVNDVSVESSNTLMTRPPTEHQTLNTLGDDRASTLKQTTVHSNLSLSDQSKTHKRSDLSNQSSSYNNSALLRYVQAN